MVGNYIFSLFSYPGYNRYQMVCYNMLEPVEDPTISNNKPSHPIPHPRPYGPRSTKMVPKLVNPLLDDGFWGILRKMGCWMICMIMLPAQLPSL